MRTTQEGKNTGKRCIGREGGGSFKKTGGRENKLDTGEDRTSQRRRRSQKD